MNRVELDVIQKERRKQAKLATTLYCTNAVIHYGVNLAYEVTPYFRKAWKKQIELSKEYDFENRKREKICR